MFMVILLSYAMNSTETNILDFSPFETNILSITMIAPKYPSSQAQLQYLNMIRQ